MTMEKCKCGNKLASIYSRYTGYNPVRIPNAAYCKNCNKFFRINVEELNFANRDNGD